MIVAPRPNLIRLRHQEGSYAQWQTWIGMNYLRHEAVIYRQLAEKTENIFGKQELFDLAAVCEEAANSIEDRLTGG
jgi:hypothetical protein